MCLRLPWRLKSSAARFQVHQKPLNFEVESSVERWNFAVETGFVFLLLLVALLQFPLDPRVRNQPKECSEHVQSAGNPWTHKRKWDRDEVKRSGEFALSLPSNSLCHEGLATFLGNDGTLQN